MKTIAITGASGFLGRHTTIRAIKRGWTVKVIVRREDVAENLKRLGAEPSVLRVLDLENLTPILTDCDAVIDFIGIVSPAQGDFEEINVNNARIIIEAAQKANVSRFIVPTGLGLDQYNQKAWATNAYFLSKLHIEELCQAGTQPFVIFRPSTILGPGDELIPGLVQDIANGHVSIIGDGNIPMQPISIINATDAFLNAAQGDGLDNTIYDLVGPEVFNMNTLVAKTMLMMLQVGFPKAYVNLRHVPVFKAVQELELSQEEVDITQCDSLGDNSALIAQLHVEITPIDEILQETINEVKREWNDPLF